MKRLVCTVAALLALTPALFADPMNELDYQGKVLVDDVPFTGDGFFKFAISDEANTINHWANDGTATGEPTGSVTNAVWNGLFSEILGESPMDPIDPSIFDTTNSLFLRVWFDSGTGFNEMLPAQKIVGGAFSLNALFLNGLTAEIIQSNSVMQATNSITLAGDVTGTPQANSIAAGVIVDADVNATAAIAGTKVVQGTTAARGTLQLETGTTGTTAIGPGHPSLNAFSTVNSIVASTPNSGFGIVASNGVSVTVAGTNVVISSSFTLPNLDNIIWVARNGTAAGPGTIDQPFDTPQAGYSAASGLSTSEPSAVVIAAGDYASAGMTLTMTSRTVHVVGIQRPKISSLTVSSSVDVVVMGGYMNVEGVMFDGGTPTVTVVPGGGGIRFHNCVINNSVSVEGVAVVFQDCRITEQTGGPALAVGTTPGSFAGRVGVYQSSLENRSAAGGTIEIGYPGMAMPNVQDFEVIGCEIVNQNGAFGPPGTPGPAVQDWSPFHGAGFPVKLFTHNYIKGPLPDPGLGFPAPAISDPNVFVFPYPAGTGPFLAVYNNTIMGSVGVGAVASNVVHSQYYGNNMVLGGLINNVGGPVGWIQAGAGTGMDADGNVEHELAFPFPTPDSWDD